jgi:hypothetical protein
MENSSNGCEDYFLEWRLERECVHVSTRRICFFVKGQEHKVCKIIKSLYGLKQASRAWYEKLIEHLLKLNFKHFNLDDATFFVEKVGKNVVYLVVYVYGLFITGNTEN